MPFAQADLEKFVTGLGLSADKAKVVMDAIGSDGAILNKFGEHVLRQEDYSSKMDALKKEQEKLEADFQDKVRKEEEFHNSVAQWKTDAEKRAEAAITAAKNEAAASLSAARDKIRALAEKNGIPEEEIKDLIAAAPVTRTNNDPPPRSDDGRFMTRESFQKEAEFYSLLPAIQMDLRDDYYRLYGNDAPRINWEKVIADAKSNKLSLADQFEKSYNLTQKRTELAEKQRTADLEKARKEGEEAARTKMLAEHPELSSRTIDRQRVGSPILDKAREHAEEDRKKRGGTGPQDTVSAAVAAFNSGKYKDGKAA